VLPAAQSNCAKSRVTLDLCAAFCTAVLSISHSDVRAANPVESSFFCRLSASGSIHVSITTPSACRDTETLRGDWTYEYRQAESPPSGTWCQLVDKQTRSNLPDVTVSLHLAGFVGHVVSQFLPL
jgi:hypothetical protein